MNNMSTPIVGVSTVPVYLAKGLKAAKVVYSPYNPGKSSEDKKMYKKGYWYIEIESDGSNPFFPKKTFSVILLSYIKQHIPKLNKPCDIIYMARGNILIKRIRSRQGQKKQGNKIVIVPIITFDIIVGGLEQIKDFPFAQARSFTKN